MFACGRGAASGRPSVERRPGPGRAGGRPYSLSPRFKPGTTAIQTAPGARGVRGGPLRGPTRTSASSGPTVIEQTVTPRVDDPTSGTGAAAPPRRRVSDFEQGRRVTRIQLEHYLRTYRFFGLLGFVFLISGLTLAFEVEAGVTAVRVAQLFRSSEYISNYLANAGLWVVLAAAFFAGDALSVDFSTGAGYYMLVLPVRRPVLLAGRYAAAALVTLAIVGVYYVFGTIGTIYFFGVASVPWGPLALSFAAAALFTLAALSVAFCVSACVRSPSAGVLITILVLYVGFTALQMVVELAGFEPWFSLSYAGGTMAAILDTDFVHVQSIPLGEDQFYTIWSATVTEGLTIMAAYVAVFLPLSAYLYQRQESTG
jgi:ABC-type transport system involved in multi-copper enzyme maturation permease subunit